MSYLTKAKKFGGGRMSKAKQFTMALTSLVDVIERIFPPKGKFCTQETLIVST